MATDAVRQRRVIRGVLLVVVAAVVLIPLCVIIGNVTKRWVVKPLYGPDDYPLAAEYAFVRAYLACVAALVLAAVLRRWWRMSSPIVVPVLIGVALPVVVLVGEHGDRAAVTADTQAAVSQREMPFGTYWSGPVAIGRAAAIVDTGVESVVAVAYNNQFTRGPWVVSTIPGRAFDPFWLSGFLDGAPQCAPSFTLPDAQVYVVTILADSGSCERAVKLPALRRI
jgi:hypothetical protein